MKFGRVTGFCDNCGTVGDLYGAHTDTHSRWFCLGCKFQEVIGEQVDDVLGQHQEGE